METVKTIQKHIKLVFFVSMFLVFTLPANAQENVGTAGQLGFLVWGSGEPVYCAPGSTGAFTDGNLISILNLPEDLNFANDVITIEMVISKKSLTHSFKLEKLADLKSGKASWIIVDPSGTDYAPSFTDKFLSEICKQIKGKLTTDIHFLVNGKKLRSGSLTYNSDGKHAKYKQLLPKFKDVKGAREQANAEYKKQLDEEERKQDEIDRQKSFANSFRIKIENRNPGYTYYIISIDQKTLSETIHEVLPGKTAIIPFYKSGTYQLRTYNQNESKESARDLGMVDQKSDNKIFIVK